MKTIAWILFIYTEYILSVSKPFYTLEERYLANRSYIQNKLFVSDEAAEAFKLLADSNTDIYFVCSIRILSQNCIYVTSIGRPYCFGLYGGKYVISHQQYECFQQTCFNTYYNVYIERTYP